MRSELQKRGGCFCDGFNWLHVRFFELALVLVRLDHVASVIVNADLSARRAFLFEDELLSAPRRNFRRENGFVFVQRNLMRVKMPTRVRLGAIQHPYGLA